MRKPNTKPMNQKVKCPWCPTVSNLGVMSQWHFDKCKHKDGNTRRDDIGIVPEGRNLISEDGREYKAANQMYNMTLEEIAEILYNEGYTDVVLHRSHVAYIQNSAIRKLKRMIGA